MNFLAGLFLVASLVTAGAPLALAGEQLPAVDSLSNLAPKIYLDCETCDQEYLRTEIHFLNFVRDRRLAGVHALVSTQQTGSGGTEYMLEFIGLRNWEGHKDILKFSVLESDSDDTIRKEILRTIKLGGHALCCQDPAGTAH